MLARRDRPASRTDGDGGLPALPERFGQLSPPEGMCGMGDPGRDLPLPEIELISKPVLLQ